MVRIFLMLAIFSVALLVTNLVLGFTGGDYNGKARALVEARRAVAKLQREGQREDPEFLEARSQLQALSKEFQPMQHRKTMHTLVGIASALVTVLVNSITVTYFIGTSRWCREVVETYRLDPQLAAQSNQLKRKTFPWVMLGMATIIVILALGGASDPGANFEGSQKWVAPHYLAALMGTAVIAWSFLVQVGRIGANYQIIDQIMKQVEARQS